MKHYLVAEQVIADGEAMMFDSEAHTDDLYRSLFYRMQLVRAFEERVLALYDQGLIHGTIHLSIGQEASAVGTTYALSAEDAIFVTHRGHGEVIGKGVEPKYMFAELLGKANGCCAGRGGSMHLADFSKGVLAANGIVGANAPIACGAALTYRKKGLQRVSVNYVGDGGNNEGAYLESLNLAALWRLPVIFVTVNNQYAMSTPLRSSFADPDLAKRAVPFGIKCLEVDGNDVLAVYRAMRKARRMALKEGPVMLIAHTYRISGHSKSDLNRYRSEAEIELWRERCPLARFEQRCLADDALSRTVIDQIKRQVTAEIETALAYAVNSPDADPAQTLGSVYAQ